jgi:hypothetical protein
MEQNKNNNAKSLNEILSNKRYIIPIYQRSYAWGKPEISQLINDIYDIFEINKNQKHDINKSYYLGFLVCFKREDDVFELLDGQQRHTTITLINWVLKNWESLKIEDSISTTNLKFDSRKNIQRFIEGMYESNLEDVKNSNVVGVDNFTSAINIIESELRERKNIQTFAQYFYNNVKLFRIEVPQDTDLNHYFEIMNNRGEQLEKHEILKARLMSNISDKNNKKTFAQIWDACSDMSDYIYSKFSSEAQKFLIEFGENGHLKNEKIDFSKISIPINNTEKKPEDLSKIDEQKKYKSMSDIIEHIGIYGNSWQEKKEHKEKYKSIIDFPNFLLQVLKLKNADVSLDDKKLLDNFDKFDSKSEKSILEPEKFIHDLLKYRILFDKYVIKQDLTEANEEKQNWGIRTTDNKSILKTFENDEELVKLQTMLYYSNPSNTNNNWLHEILKKNTFATIDAYTEIVFDIAKGKFDKDKAQLSYPEITIFNIYFIDFLLWKLYKEKIQGKNEIFKEGTLEYKISKNLNSFNTFKFKQLNSKEHLLPQSKVNENQKDVLNTLGNLCLISASQNSAGNNEHPKYKKDRFAKDNSSLKRLIMFESFNGESWTEKEIEAHQTEMIKLLEEHYKQP